MQTIKLLFPCFFLILSYQVIIGQPQYQANDYGGPGTIYLYNRLLSIPPIQEVTKSGANVNWNLSTNAELNTHPTQIVTPAEGIDALTFLTICGLGGNTPLECFTIWNATKQALLSKDTLSLFGFSLVDLQRYQNKTQNLLLENFFGFTVDFGGFPTAAVIVYNSPDTVLQFPVTYSDNWTSSIDWSIDLSATGQNIIYRSHQHRTSNVDAWGSVTTPYDTFTNVIRVRSEIVHTDTLFTDTLDVPVNVTQVEYMWYDTNYKLPIMIATGVIVDTLEIINVVEYIYEATCATPTWDAQTDTDAYYIDATGSVTVNFEILNSNANEYTWDFGDGDFAVTDGSVSHTYTIAGDYSVAVTGCMTNCLPLNSCSFDIIDFSVIDTLTSVEIVSGIDRGIKLYPNPVEEAFNLYIPEAMQDQEYTVLDITGRIVLSGILHSGHSTILMDMHQNGVYTIQMIDKQGVSNQITMMKFVLLRK